MPDVSGSLVILTHRSRDLNLVFRRRRRVLHRDDVIVAPLFLLLDFFHTHLNRVVHRITLGTKDAVDFRVERYSDLDTALYLVQRFVDGLLLNRHLVHVDVDAHVRPIEL